MSTTSAVSNFSNFPFTPLQLPGCIVWFDSADSNTYSGAGTTGFEWRSKGLNSLTASVNAGTGPSAATCNGYPCIYFSNSNTKLTTGTIPTLGAAGTTWITAATSLVPVASQLDAAVVIASITPEKAIRWTGSGGSMVYALESGSVGSSTASNNGVRGFTQNAAALNIYQNGVLNCNTVPPAYSSGTNVSFSIGQWNTSGLVGWINEIIIYNSVLTVAQYQQVEGYLAWKYGYNSQLPATHPNFRARPPVAGQLTNFGQTVNPTITLIEPVTQQNTSFWRAFSPTSIPNCVGWFDGKDPQGTGVVPTDGAAVSTWVDKSGQANNAVTVGSNPTYNSNGFVIFNGSNTLRFTNPNALVASNTFSIFVVEQRSNIQNAVNWTYWLAGSTVVQNTNLQFGYRNSNDVTLGFFNNDVDYATVPNPTVNEPFRVWDGIWDGTNQYIYLNGSNVAQRTQVGNVTSWSNGSIGYYGAGPTFFTGNIGEIIFFKPAINDTNRQQVEGYLTYKWGLQSNLPTTHPVASNQSAILFSNIVIPLSKTIVMSGTNRWQPSAVSGLALWLDAADSSAIQFSSGANISNWRDKSGNGRNFTLVGTTNPVLTPNILNNRPLVTFNGTDQRLNNAGIVFPSTAYTIFSLQYLTSNNGSYQRVINGSIFFVGSKTGNVAVFTGSNGPAGGWNDTNALVPAFTNLNRWALVSSYSIPSGSSNSLFNYINGSQYDTKNGSTLPMTGLTVGGHITLASGEFWNGYVAEILLYSNALSDSQRQITEGYLAWKWGLRSSLPANHPYKIIPPS